MQLLKRTGDRFEEWFTTEAGLRFRGRLLPVADSAALTSTYADPRQALHVRVDEPLQSGTVITDPAGRKLLLANNDTRAGLRKVFRLFLMTEQVVWKRAVTTTEPITGLAKATSLTSLGTIWVTREVYGREEADRGLHVGFDRMRILTGAAVVLNDELDGSRVTRVIKSYGVNLAEVQ